ncbi:MAG TPA: hypothetical protein VGK52_01375 [Polyangia bacterium]|jgi:hypothetical protein
MSAIGILVWLLAAGDPSVPHVPPTAAPSAMAPATTPPPAPAPAVEPAHLPPGVSALRLGLTYVHVLSEDGDLTDAALSTNAAGLDWGFPSNRYGRTHLGLAYQSESRAGYAARGFRIDLISFGYPIVLVDADVRLELEPIVTLVRGEIMFLTGGSAFLRMEAGVGLELSATLRQWFVGVQPLAVDFRYWDYSSARSQTGLGRVFPFRIAIGHEF